MNKLFAKLTNEWEKTTCWMVAAIMTAFVLTWINLGDDGDTTGSGRKPPKNVPLLNRGAFDFMEKMPDAAIGGANPLCFRYVPEGTVRPWKSPSRWGTKRPSSPPPTTAKTPTERPKRPQRLRPLSPSPQPPAAPVKVSSTDPAPVAPVAPVAPAAPVAGPTITKDPVKPPPPAKTPPQKREIVFCGLMKTLSGKTVAQAQVHNPTTKKKVLDFWTSGAQVQGVKIESITDQAIEVSDPAGKKHTISLGNENKKSITFE